MGRILTIRIEANDLGQVIDGLYCRLEAWQTTAEYLELGCSRLADVVVEECHNGTEARKIAAHYARIIDALEAQVAAQGNAS